MRAIHVASLLTIAVMIVAGVAIAGGPSEHASKGQEKAAEMRAAHNATGNDSDDNDTRGKPANRTRDDNGTRPAAVAAYWAALKEIRASWHENATKVREDCRAQAFDHANSTRDARVAHAHCVRDGYKALRVAYAAKLEAARDAFRAAMAS
ncbi:MAG TPA: hypothetical protein VHH36_00610 [Candidatus Thermoplasmatota archaeon]|nr:hypothetical protein [Candidatus Thermoplasmatota archaeon]